MKSNKVFVIVILIFIASLLLVVFVHPSCKPGHDSGPYCAVDLFSQLPQGVVEQLLTVDAVFGDENLWTSLLLVLVVVSMFSGVVVSAFLLHESFVLGITNYLHKLIAKGIVVGKNSPNCLAT